MRCLRWIAYDRVIGGAVFRDACHRRGNYHGGRCWLTILLSWPLCRAVRHRPSTQRMSTMPKARFDFNAETKRTIALRSGYRCAHPECEGRTTVGPAKQSDKYENTGKGQSY